MKALVIGGRGGIGCALVEALCAMDRVDSVVATYHRTLPDLQRDKLAWLQLDVTSERNMTAVVDVLGGEGVDWVINCVGMLHCDKRGPEKSVSQVDPDFFLESMRINCLPTLLLAKHLMKPLKASEQSVFATVSARVGSIEENYLGGWYSYRASKAALNMALKTLSIEWRNKVPGCCVAALHPGTTDTFLSKPFQRNVAPEKLFTPGRTADQLLAVVAGLSPRDSGRFWSWDGKPLPW